MYPIIFEYKDIIIPTWHILFVIATISSFFVFDKLTYNYFAVMRPKSKAMLFLCVYIGGYLGARALSIMIEENDYKNVLDFTLKLFNPAGSLTLYGGVIGGFLGGVLFVLITHLSAIRIADFAFLSLLLGISIGRIGCFLNGCDYGIPVSQTFEKSPFWAVKFPYLDYYRIPVQLMESAISLILFCIGLFIIKRYYHKLPAGTLAVFSINSYAISRFFLEYLRDDPRGWVIKDVLSPSQFISLVIMLISLILILNFLLQSKKKVERR